MNRKALRELLGEAATDDIVDAIMAANGNDINSAKGDSDTLRQQLETLKQQNESLKKEAGDSASSQKSLEEQVAEAKKQAAKAMHELNEQSALSVFAKAGLSEEECRPLLGAVVSDDRKATVAAAQSIADIVTAKVQAAKEQAGKQQLGGMQPPAGGKPSDGTVTTKAEFLKLPYQQQMELKQQNPDILSELH